MAVLVFIFVSIFTLSLGGIIPKIENRIIGGEETTIEQHPYQVSLQYEGDHKCGGSIVNQDTIVTAAHCVHGAKYNLFTVRVGSTLHYEGTVHEITSIIEHPDYEVGASVNNDIAILKLSKPLTFSDKVQPIELQPAGSPVPVGTTALVSGWGLTIPDVPSIPDKLRVVDVDVISSEHCQRSYEGQMVITDTMLCAQTLGHDSCQQDSGGPLAANGKLIGVVSWGIGCANPAYPGVYADVSALHEFVAKYM